MKIPKKVRVCGLTYDVVMSDELYLDEGCLGTHNPNTMTITLQNHEFNKDRQVQVFIHELVHAIDTHYLNAKLTEDQVNLIANGVYQILADNDCFLGRKDK